VNDPNSVRVLKKAALLLDFLERSEEAQLSVTELARAMGEPRSSVYRLLRTLQELGWIEAGSTRGTYRLGLKLFRLGGAVMRRFDVRNSALPLMRDIHAETGETVFLCVRRGFEAVCIERIDGDRVQSLALRLGGALPLHVGAAPRTLLSFETPEFRNEYARTAELTSYTEYTVATSERLEEALEAVRNTGYAVSNEDVTPGIAAVGAPIFDHTGKIRAALSISGVVPTILGDRAERIVRLVVDGAKEVSLTLGYDQETGGKG
jgi:DNA-binding IclR family transcriptional regulator